ncbi:MAG: aldose 1-epimerase [Promethearchaeota archaeon]
MIHNSRYQVKSKQIVIHNLNLSIEKYILIDNLEKIYVEIIPALGSNIIGFYKLMENQRIDFIYVPGNLETILTQKIRYYGNPILFPFPNRIPNGNFIFEEKSYHFEPNFQDGTAIHGLVFNKPWQVMDKSQPNNDAAILKTSLNSKSHPPILTQFPFPFEIKLEFRLENNNLHLSTLVSNIGESFMPMGYGIHPYFTAGLHSNERDKCILKIPALEYWELENCLPTGHTKQVADNYNLVEGKKLKNIYFDDIFTHLISAIDGWTHFELINPSQNYKLKVSADQNFHHIVIFAPKDNNFVCIEPYTCITNAINIAPEQIIHLAPNKSIRLDIKINIEI